ncbi:MAG: pyrroline-5-carboxylate reductase [Acidimicrobiales bacterium]|nr:pyrroline-5-carboxylate reductase [Acidimicrobiales bacterium]HRW36737.1 pyrroline-5-carboxylate reductase [Aquihabitans sp.]
MTKLVVVGGGKMGEALLGGLVAGGWAAADELAVVEPVAARREELAARFEGLTVVAEPVEADGALVAVKPQLVVDVCDRLGALGVGRVLSIAAGVRIATIEARLPAGTAVVRAMPNTPSLVGCGAAAIAGGVGADEGDLAWAEGILSSVGIVVRLPEDKLDAVTGLSGSGPAYVFLVAEALIDAGVLVGLPRDVAAELAIATLRGSAELLATGIAPAQARADVTSPGGTTAAGLRALEDGRVRAAFLDAVVASCARAGELG